MTRIEDRQPPAFHGERLLAAVRAGDRRLAERIVQRWPAAAEVDVWSVCAAGRPRRLGEILAADPAAATAAHADDGWQPILYACASPLHRLGAAAARDIRRCVDMLLAAGADANTHTFEDDGGTPCKLPALFRACWAGNAAVVRTLLEHGAQPDDCESVYHAAQLDHRDCLQALLDHGADVSSRQAPYDNTPLYFLAGYKEPHAGCAAATRGMRWLLTHGADPNVASGAGDETPLHAFARGGRSRQAARMLLDYGARIDQPRADGRTAYVLAVRCGSFAIADVLAARGADTTRLTPRDQLLGACLRADEAAARALLERDPALLAELDAEDRSVVTLAAEQGRADAVRLMAALRFDLATERRGSGTPLHAAAWMGRPDTVRVLVELGAPLDPRDSAFGSSPLAWAVHGSRHCRKADDDYCTVVELLLDAGARRAESINRWGEAPETIGSPRVVALLRRRGFATPASPDPR